MAYLEEANRMDILKDSIFLLADYNEDAAVRMIRSKYKGDTKELVKRIVNMITYPDPITEEPNLKFSKVGVWKTMQDLSDTLEFREYELPIKNGVIKIPKWYTRSYCEIWVPRMEMWIEGLSKSKIEKIKTKVPKRKMDLLVF